MNIDWNAVGSVATAISSVITILLWRNTRAAVKQTADIIKDKERRDRAIVVVPSAKLDYSNLTNSLSVTFNLKNVGRSVATGIRVELRIHGTNQGAGNVHKEERMQDLAIKGRSEVVVAIRDLTAASLHPEALILSAITYYRTAGATEELRSHSFANYVSHLSPRPRLEYIVDFSPHIL